MRIDFSVSVKKDIMSCWQLTTPIAFFIFNRPETTRRVFELIRQARPPMLLVVADGPRISIANETEYCNDVRDIIETVDWPCKVMKNYSNINLGCKSRVSSGLDWVFSTVEEAIILEDDCLPHPTFFRFCEEMLEKYRDNEQVMMVSGFNPQNNLPQERSTYFFSKYPHIWGWASWRRTWKFYDVNMKLWPAYRDTGRYYDFCDSINEAKFWKKCFNAVYQGKIDTWDAQVSFMSFCQNAMTIFPNINLISNIGFGPDATHTKVNNGITAIETQEFLFPIEHSSFIHIDIAKDMERRKKEYLYKGFFYKLYLLAARIFKGSHNERNI